MKDDFPNAPREPSFTAEQQHELRHRVLSGENNPFRRAQELKREYLARESGAEDHRRRFRRPEPTEDQ